MTDQAVSLVPDEATLKAHYISALGRSVVEISATHHDLETEMSWFPDMLVLAEPASVIAQDLERKPLDPFDGEKQPV